MSATCSSNSAAQAAAAAPERAGSSAAALIWTHDVSIPFATADQWWNGANERRTARRQDRDDLRQDPAGIDEGKKIRLRGQGRAGAKGATAGRHPPHLYTLSRIRSSTVRGTICSSACR